MVTQFYGNTCFDRATLSRKSEGDTADRRKTIYIPVWKNLFLYDWDEGKVQFYPEIPNEWAPVTTTKVFLGIDGGCEIFCLDISEIKRPERTNIVLLSLRKIFPNLNEKEAALLAYSQGILHWHSTHKYCGRCGSNTKSEEKGHIRVCCNKDCGQILYPRVDPAIITLIEFKKKNSPAVCLLNINKTGKGLKCSPFAGFVEIGESLEDAVVREMKEEVGLEVHRVRYRASQPWPFPSAIMIGFVATAKTTDYKLDGDEVLDAKWFTANELLEQVNKGTLELSNEDSIARSLIQQWISKQFKRKT